MRLFTCMLLLGVLASAGELAPVTLPVASKGAPDKAHDGADRVIISLNRLGQVHVKGKKTTLHGMVEHVEERMEVYDRIQKAVGKSGYEKVGGANASRMFALLRVDKDVPWIHVQWLMLLLVEQRIYKVQFAVKQKDGPDPKPPALESKLKAHLPTDKGILAGGKEPPGEIKIIVHIVARQEMPAKWGPDGVPVNKPTAFLYRFGDRTSSSLNAAAKWIRDAKKAAAGAKGVPVIGEIQAGHKVPFHQIASLLNEFRAEGLEHVDFFGTAIPHQSLRKLPYLPYPKKNYPAR